SALQQVVRLTLAIVAVFALVDAARVPRSARAARCVRGAAVVQAGLAGLGLATVLAAHRWSGDFAMLGRWFDATNVASFAGRSLLALLLGYGLLDVGRAAGARLVRWLAVAVWIAAGLQLAVTLAVAFAMFERAWPAGLTFWAMQLGLAGACAVAASAARRLPVAGLGAASPYRAADRSADDEAPSTLARAYEHAPAGLTVYLRAAFARLVCAGLSLIAVSGVGHADGHGAVREAHDAFFLVALLSAAASIAMLLGLRRLTHLPSSSGAREPARVALVCSAIGFALELGATWLVLDALSDAWTWRGAANLAPALFAVACPLGGATIWGLGTAVARLAQQLELQDAQRAARGVTPLAIVAASLVLLGAVVHQQEAAFGLLLLAAPFGVVAAVRFVVAARAVAQRIRERLSDQEADAA
ncbi:MAG TPA: hypothetical protein VHB21_19805, partial [Minicystis sp.]|nr:hypothetical protein [Minicystis sp.]